MLRTLFTRRLFALLVLMITAMLTSFPGTAGDSEWPQGFFTLPATDNQQYGGCPDKNFLLGYRSHWLETTIPNRNEYSRPNHMRGKQYHELEYNLKPQMTDFFCTKNDEKGVGVFPRGSYCVNKAYWKPCPRNMTEGSFQIDDDDARGYDNGIYGTIPAGIYNRDTLYFFCCMTNSHNTEPMRLPIKKPFFLYRRGKRCEDVEGMVVSQERVTYDSEDTPWFRLEYADGDVPLHDLYNAKLYLCYYSPHTQKNA